MKTLLIVYHSTTRATAQMAEAAANGARSITASTDQTEVQVRLLHASVAASTDVLAADAYIFATPENLAAISGLMKDFFDRCYYDVLDQINGRRYASIICAGSDGSSAARQIERIATGWRLKVAAAPLIICTHAQTREQILAAKDISAANLVQGAELGATLAAGLALGAF